MKDTADKEKKFSDLNLCYSALGLSFSDNPEQVGRAYRKLKDEYGKAMRSPDPAERSRATEDLEQLEEMFTAITKSVIYKDYAREYEKQKQLKEAKKQEQPENIQAEEIVMMFCPACGKPIKKLLKKCPYCNKESEKLFTARNIIIFVAVILVIAVIIIKFAVT